MSDAVRVRVEAFARARTVEECEELLEAGPVVLGRAIDDWSRAYPCRGCEREGDCPSVYDGRNLGRERRACVEVG